MYLDIDLSGDGLVGRVKSVLEMKPLDSSNPLTLTQASVPGQDPNITTFELPIPYNTIINGSALSLNLDGADVVLENYTSAGDGNTLVNWHTSFSPAGQHYLQAKINIGSPGDDTSILYGLGVVVPYNSLNAIQFFESDSMFNSSGAYLDAKLPDADINVSCPYSIDFQDPSKPSSPHIRWIRGTTTSGLIQEDWSNLYKDDGVTTFTGNVVNAVFTVSPSGRPPVTATRTLYRTTWVPKTTWDGWGNGFDFVYLYTPKSSVFANDFANNFGVTGKIWLAMQNVVDTLLMQPSASGGFSDFYTSTFDIYTHQNGPSSAAYPGYVNSQSTVTGTLLPDLQSGYASPCNFFCHGHGSGNWIGDAASDVHMTAQDVASWLVNYTDPFRQISFSIPYRFVFLDGCYTASGNAWANAFGIFALDDPNQAGRSSFGPQAFVGWKTEVADWLGGSKVNDGAVVDHDASVNIMAAYANTLNTFYNDWMNGKSLKVCIDNAANAGEYEVPFAVSGNLPLFTVTVKDVYGPGIVTYTCANLPTSPIVVVGHSGLTRTKLIPGDDGNYKP